MVGQQYKILSELGAGGMGIVYHGVDVMLEREVAIKKLRSEFSRTADIAERFRREAKIQARLNHPNIAHLYSFFKDGDSFYIVMEFVDGTPFSKLLPMPWQQAVVMFLEILEGLEYAHSLGVLHRDLKPDNIMAGPRGEVKIMDFGIAHVLGSVRQTREQSLVGTLQYVCPELINSKEIGPRSDIYSLGILLFEIVSGKLPFTAENDFALLHQHLEVEPPLLSTVAPDVPPFLDEAIFKAMRKVPEDRFASCREMADFLSAHAPDLPPKTIYADVNRSIRRIDSLLDGGEVELAAMVVSQTNPGIAVEGRVNAAKNAAAGAQQQQGKHAYLRETLQKLAAFEAAGNREAAQELAREALDRYPRVTAFQIAHAHFRK
ncbi:MAG TPA: serine/threonine-protein kinase [Bryobacteraceae bacterium]|jgi:serine/threonine protein kinase|nr:serine/threonine-protein kinase [Bryobacteraceae bacterium]